MGFLRRNKQNDSDTKTNSWLSRLKSGLKKTRSHLSEGLATALLGKKVIDADVLEQLETQLLIADVGIEATAKVMADLTKRVSRRDLDNAEALFLALQDNLTELLKPYEQPLAIEKSDKPFVILVIGVNGNGKTTTIGKLAKYYQAQDLSVMLAAGDTFRAAAVEQLKVWGERNEVPVIAQPTGSDSASVVFDALASASAKKVDVLIADTAGRLHTQNNLMEELKKIKRVMKKIDPDAPHEVLLVLDAGTGQNAISQAQQFNQDIGITGLTLTKLDGTAKGGIIFALGQKIGLPVRFIGVGEQLEDLRPFKTEDFVTALLGSYVDNDDTDN